MKTVLLASLSLFTLNSFAGSLETLLFDNQYYTVIEPTGEVTELKMASNVDASIYLELKCSEGVKKLTVSKLKNSEDDRSEKSEKVFSASVEFESRKTCLQLSKAIEEAKSSSYVGNVVKVHYFPEDMKIYRAGVFQNLGQMNFNH